MLRPVVAVSVTRNQPLASGGITDSFEDCRRYTLGGTFFEILCLEQRLIKNCEHGIFAEAISRAEYALTRLPDVTIGLGMITWFMSPAQPACPLCCALAAVAAMVNGKPQTIALTAHEDDFAVVSQLAQYRYGGRMDRLPPLVSLSRQDELDKVLRNVVREHAGLHA